MGDLRVIMHVTLNIINGVVVSNWKVFRVKLCLFVLGNCSFRMLEYVLQISRCEESSLKQMDPYQYASYQMVSIFFIETYVPKYVKYVKVGGDHIFVVLGAHMSPGRALIHVFNNPYATEGHLSRGYSSNRLELFIHYKYR